MLPVNGHVGKRIQIKYGIAHLHAPGNVSIDTISEFTIHSKVPCSRGGDVDGDSIQCNLRGDLINFHRKTIFFNKRKERELGHVRRVGFVLIFEVGRNNSKHDHDYKRENEEKFNTGLTGLRTHDYTALKSILYGGKTAESYFDSILKC